MKLGLYVDDIRILPRELQAEDDIYWHVARNYDEAIDMLIRYQYSVLSLDHDIASWNDEGREMTGYDIALWLAERNNDGNYVPPKIYVHSANPVGVKNIRGVIDRYLS